MAEVWSRIWGEVADIVVEVKRVGYGFVYGKDRVIGDT